MTLTTDEWLKKLGVSSLGVPGRVYNVLYALGGLVSLGPTPLVVLPSWMQQWCGTSLLSHNATCLALVVGPVDQLQAIIRPDASQNAIAREDGIPGVAHIIFWGPGA